MGMDRRAFIKLAGVAAVGVAGVGPRILAGEEQRQTGRHAVAAGKRWAMVVDLGKCRRAGDCTKCIDACHHEHNVPDFDNAKDEVKWVWKDTFEHAFHEQEHDATPEEVRQSPVLLMCNHCDRPPCVKVCPTGATWKREGDGIVMMDWHRCIGCRYCMAACPYGSRSFNWRDPRPHIEETNRGYPTRMRGVVEKCTFCEERLAKGKMPACVEACSAGALVFGDLEDPDSEVRRVLEDSFAIRRKPELGTGPGVFDLV